MGRSIVVSGNCQISALSDVLDLVFPDDLVYQYSIEHAPVPELDDLLRTADCWVQIGTTGNDAIARRVETSARIIVVPTLAFDAFQPDAVYAVADHVPRFDAARAFDPKNLFHGACPYHSAIGLWAWRRGLDPSDASSLFSAPVFEALGYLDRYDAALTWLARLFDESELDFGTFYLRARRLGAFMYTPNHPTLEASAIVAKQVAVALGAPPSVFDDPVESYVDDHLARAIVWPVYPPIAAHLGVAGSYRFRLWQCWFPTVESFLEHSWRAYGTTDPSTVYAVRDGFDDAYDAVLGPLVGTRASPR